MKNKKNKDKNKKYETVDSNKHISQLWGDDGVGGYTKKEGISFRYLKKMLPQFKSGNVLEIGPGTGRLALMLHQQFEIQRYTLLDLEKNIKDSKNLLEKNNFPADYVISQDYESLFSKKFDLIMSHYCLSEVPEYYRNNLLDHVMPNSKMAFIIDGDGFRPEYNGWLKAMFEKHYKKVCVEDTKVYKYCPAYVGYEQYGK